METAKSGLKLLTNLKRNKRTIQSVPTEYAKPAEGNSYAHVRPILKIEGATSLRS